MGFTERTVRKLPLNYDVTWNYRADGLGIAGSSPTIPQENDGGNNGNTSAMFEQVFTADGISASFTVTENNVGKTYTLATINLGINANTNMYLFEDDGITEILNDTSSSMSSSVIMWQADAS